MTEIPSKRQVDQMIELADALNIVENNIKALDLSCETVKVEDCLGRILYEDQYSMLDIPPFDKSAMDGYALPGGDECDEYNILETVAAGSVPTKKLTAGTATKVMTGAPVPDGAAKVIMVEKTVESDGKVRITKPSNAVNICQKGEDIRCGDLVLAAKSTIGPVEIGNLVSVGITSVKVVRPIRVAILSTGDEIVDSLEKAAQGKIMNSNGPMLGALCKKFSLDVVINRSVKDQLEATVSAVSEALSKADMVILSGGVSVGEFDFVGEALKQLGLISHFNKVAIKPGKPMTFASMGNKAVMALPGNPVAVFLMFHLFVLHAVKLLNGQKNSLRYIKLALACDYHRKRADRMGFLPGRAKDCMVKPVEYHGTAHLGALLNCDGFFIVPKGTSCLSSGDMVDFLSLRGAFE